MAAWLHGTMPWQEDRLGELLLFLFFGFFFLWVVKWMNRMNELIQGIDGIDGEMMKIIRSDWSNGGKRVLLIERSGYLVYT